MSSKVQALASLTKLWAAEPARFVRDTFRSDPQGNKVDVDVSQERILDAIARKDRVVVRSSHGIGKTTTAAWAGMWWLATRSPSLVVTMAGTWGHLSDRLWPEIKTWARNWRLREAFEWQEMGVYSKSAPESWRMVATSSDRAENVEGFHSPNVLVIVDEAKAMPDELWSAIRGSLTQVAGVTERPKVLVLSTPPLAKVGWYADLFGTKSSGWETIHISGFDSPRVSKEWIEEMRVDFGEDSPTYQSKVLGEIPEGAATSVVQLRWVEAAQLRAAKPSLKPVVVTCDVAREGEDLTVIGRIKDCKFEVRKWKASNDLMECAGMCKVEVEASRAKYLIVDDSGLGGGVTDRLIEMQRTVVEQGQPALFPKDCVIVPLKFGTTADRKDRFSCAKDELWWATRIALRDGTLALQTEHELAALALPRGSSLKSQLLAPIYSEDSTSRIKVWDKRSDNRELTRALPTKSPDLAHALILGVKLWSHARDEKRVESFVKEDGTFDYVAAEIARKKALIERMIRPEVGGGSGWDQMG